MNREKGNKTEKFWTLQQNDAVSEIGVKLQNYFWKYSYFIFLDVENRFTPSPMLLRDDKFTSIWFWNNYFLFIKMITVLSTIEE